MATVSCGAHCSEAGYLKEGILGGAFNFKVASAWASVRSEKIQLSVLLPSGESVDDWLEASSSMTHSWPQFLSISPHCKRHVAPKNLHVLRRAVKGRHLWRSLRPQWSFLSHGLYPTGPGNYSRAALRKTSLVTAFITRVEKFFGNRCLLDRIKSQYELRGKNKSSLGSPVNGLGLVSLASPRRKQWSD